MLGSEGIITHEIRRVVTTVIGDQNAVDDSGRHGPPSVVKISEGVDMGVGTGSGSVADNDVAGQTSTHMTLGQELEQSDRVRESTVNRAQVEGDAMDISVSSENVQVTLPPPSTYCRLLLDRLQQFVLANISNLLTMTVSTPAQDSEDSSTNQECINITHELMDRLYQEYVHPILYVMTFSASTSSFVDLFDFLQQLDMDLLYTRIQWPCPCMLIEHVSEVCSVFISVSTSTFSNVSTKWLHKVYLGERRYLAFILVSMLFIFLACFYCGHGSDVRNYYYHDSNGRMLPRYIRRQLGLP